MQDAEKQPKNSADHLKVYQWKKGQSGNPKGRPKGRSLKEWTRERLAKMTDEERDAFLEGIPKEVVWKMVEGNPENTTDLLSGGEKIVFVPTELIDKHNININDTPQSTEPDSTGQA